MVEHDEPRPVRRNLLLSTALIAVPLLAGVAIINDAMPAAQANAGMSEAAVTAPAPDAAAEPLAFEVADATAPSARKQTALIDATFAALPGEDEDVAAAANRAADAVAAEPDAIAVRDEAEDDDALPPEMSAVRRVRTTAIKVVPTESGLSTIPDVAPQKEAIAAVEDDAVQPTETPEKRIEVAAIDPVAATPEVVEEPVAEPAPRPEVKRAEDKPAAKGVRVGRSAVNARSGPSKSAGKVFVVDAGERVQALEAYRGWVHVIDSDGRRGWVYSDFLTGVNTKALPVADPPSRQSAQVEERKDASPAPVKVEVAAIEEGGAEAAGSAGTATRGSFTTNEHVNVRAEPNKGGDRLFVLKPGEEVRVTASNGGWSQIVTADGRRGWVYAAVN